MLFARKPQFCYCETDGSFSWLTVDAFLQQVEAMLLSDLWLSFHFSWPEKISFSGVECINSLAVSIKARIMRTR